MDHLAKLNAFELHKLVMQKIKASVPVNTKTDADVIKENHRFLWDGKEIDSWEQKLAKKYYSKLFREYCICDLSRYKENKIAMRWRTEPEVVAGKGQFVCGSKHCSDNDELRSWEINFNYFEHGEKKNALVKLRLCPSCSKRLNYHSAKRLVKKQKRLKCIKTRRISVGPSSSTGPTVVQDVGFTTNEEGSFDPEGNNNNIPNAVDVESLGQWSDKAPIEEKSREEEFGDYLEDLLL